MRRGAVMLAMIAAGASGCVSIPTSESTVTVWDNGVAIMVRDITPIDLSQVYARREWWAKNPTRLTQCVAMLERGTMTPTTRWTLSPGAYEPMFNDRLSESASERFIRGRFITWTPISGECSSTPNISPGAVSDLTDW